MLTVLKKLYKTIFQLKYKARFVDDLPSDLKPYVVYVEGRKDEEDFVKFLCPCGCKEAVTLSILSITESNWKIEYKGFLKKKVTLIPSINGLIGCRSHFFIRKGEVIWCEFQ